MLSNPSGNDFGVWYVKYLFLKNNIYSFSKCIYVIVTYIYGFSKTTSGRLEASWEREGWLTQSLVSSTFPERRLTTLFPRAAAAQATVRKDGFSSPALCSETLTACPLASVSAASLGAAAASAVPWGHLPVQGQGKGYPSC